MSILSLSLLGTRLIALVLHDTSRSPHPLFRLRSFLPTPLCRATCRITLRTLAQRDLSRPMRLSDTSWLTVLLSCPHSSLLKNALTRCRHQAPVAPLALVCSFRALVACIRAWLLTRLLAISVDFSLTPTHSATACTHRPLRVRFPDPGTSFSQRELTSMPTPALC